MFDLEQIMNLTAADAIILNDLKGIAEEAKSHSKLIHKAYHCFGIGQKKIEVWHDPFQSLPFLFHCAAIFSGKLNPAAQR